MITPNNAAPGHVKSCSTPIMKFSQRTKMNKMTISGKITLPCVLCTGTVDMEWWAIKGTLQVLATARPRLQRPNYIFYTSIYDVIWKPRLMEGQTEQALVRRRALCAASDQRLDFLLYMSICRNLSTRFLCN